MRERIKAAKHNITKENKGVQIWFQKTETERTRWTNVLSTQQGHIRSKTDRET